MEDKIQGPFFSLITFIILEKIELTFYWFLSNIKEILVKCL